MDPAPLDLDAGGLLVGETAAAAPSPPPAASATMDLDAVGAAGADAAPPPSQPRGADAVPAAGSAGAGALLAFRVRPDGTVDHPAPAGAGAVIDADDPLEDDVDMLQVGDEEMEDDVTAVAGDILGVGPTWGTVAGDPTSNLGGLGPELRQQAGADTAGAAAALQGQPGAAAAAAGTGSPSGESRPGTGGSASGGSAAAGGAAEKAGGAAAAAAEVAGVAGGRLSEGDADVRGIRGQAVLEDLPLGFSRTGAGGGGRGAEYGSEEVDGLEAGAVGQGGEFVPQAYVRHRSAGQAGIDPDPRARPDPNPVAGLRGLLRLQQQPAAAAAAVRGIGGDPGPTSSRPVSKDDFAMGGVAMPALTDDAVQVRDTTQEPKYAAEAPAGDDDAGSGQGAQLAVGAGAAPAAAAAAAAERVAAAGAGSRSSADAMFAPPAAADDTT